MRLVTLFLEHHYHYSYSKQRSEASQETHISLSVSEALVLATVDTLVKYETSPHCRPPEQSKFKSKDVLLRFLAFLLNERRPYVKSLNPSEVFLLTAATIRDSVQEHSAISLEVVAQLYISNRDYAELSPCFRDLVQLLVKQLFEYAHFSHHFSLLSQHDEEPPHLAMSYYVKLAKVLNLLFAGKLARYLYSLAVPYRLYDQLRRLSTVFSYQPSWNREAKFVTLLCNLLRV